MSKIFKYEVPLNPQFGLILPRHAKILSFQAQSGRPQIWALVDPDEEQKVTHEFRLVATGQPIEESETDLVYIGTCQMHSGSFVLHLFEIVRIGFLK